MYGVALSIGRTNTHESSREEIYHAVYQRNRREAGRARRSGRSVLPGLQRRSGGGRAHDGRAARAGGDRRRGGGRHDAPAPPGPGRTHVHRRGQGRGGQGARRGERREPYPVRQRAVALADEQSRGADRTHGARPLRAHSGYFRAARPDGRGQITGRAGAVSVYPAPSGRHGQGDEPPRRRHRHPRPRREQARERPPSYPQPHRQAQTRSRAGAAGARGAAPPAQKDRAAHGRHRRLHERGQEYAPEHADRRRYRGE